MTQYTRATSQLLLIVILIGWATSSAAQVEPPSEPMPATGTDSLGVRELPPMHLIDKNGQLVPVLKELTYEEWEELIRAKLELATPDMPPRYAIDSLRIDAKRNNDVVDVSLSLDLTLTATDWVRVPLRMSRATLTKPLECPPGEQCFLEYASDGYVLWLKVAEAPAVSAEADPEPTPDAESDVERAATGDPPIEPKIVRQQRSFDLQLSVPISVDNGESQLTIDLPRKIVRSEVSLLIDERLQFMAPPMVKLTRESVEPGMDRVVMVGASGELRLRWVVPPDDVTDMELDVQTLVLTEIRGPQLIRSTARLRVRNLAGPLQTFNVLLPPGMQLEEIPIDAGFMATVADEQQPMPADDRQPVTITLNEPTTESVDITVVGVATRTQREQFAQLDLAGFEVPGAKRQSGYHALSVEGDWYLHWTPESSNLRQVDIFPEDIETELAQWQADSVIVRFRRLSVPSSLRVRVTPQRTLIQVEASHRIFVSADQLRLESELRFRIRGRKLELIDIDLGQWQAAEAGPEELVRLEAVVESDSLLTVPLQQANGGDFVINLTAEMPLDPQQERFSLTIPEVKRSQPEREELNAAPAVLAVVADNDVRVSPVFDQLEGLTPSASVNLAGLPDREQPPRLYRQRAAGDRVKFVADKVVMPRSITVDASTRIEPLDTGSRVEVRLQYKVLRKPIEWLTLNVPARLVTPEGVQAAFQLNRKPVVATLLPDNDNESPTVEIRLPEAQSGAFEITAIYDWPSARRAEPKEERIGLIHPTDDFPFTSIRNRLTLIESTLSGDSATSIWKRAEANGNSANDATASFAAESFTPEVTVQSGSSRATQVRETSIALAWYQSWLSSVGRRDRAVFRITTDDPRVTVTFPAEADLGSIDAAVNGQPRSDFKLDNQRQQLTIDIARSNSESVTLEFLYEVAHRSSGGLWSGGVSRFQAPVIEGVIPERTYWQLVVPSDEYLWLEPAGMSSELPRTLPWVNPSTIAVTQQLNLEALSGARPTPPPAAAANVYLFSGFGDVAQFQVGLLPRRAIVLLGAGLVLVLTLPLIYLPSIRGWKAMLAAGVCVLLLGLAYPYPALLLGCAAIVGCLLALLARLLQITLSQNRRGPRLLPRRPAATNQPNGGTSLGGDAGSHATTATAPAIFAPSIGDQEAS